MAKQTKGFDIYTSKLDYYPVISGSCESDL